MFPDLRPIFLKRTGVGYINFRDDVAGRHLHLPSVNCRGARNAIAIPIRTAKASLRFDFMCSFLLCVFGE